jgi:uncharacterized protein YprB with RNaseH-like and TPR domain
MEKKSYHLVSHFAFINGIGEVTERILRDEYRDWYGFMEHGSGRYSRYLNSVIEAIDAFEHGNVQYLASMLDIREHWRIMAAFPEKALYIDIETTGLTCGYYHTTLIGTLKENVLAIYRKDTDNLREICEKIASDDIILCGYFSSRFDIPFLDGEFRTELKNLPHVDLCFLARRIGWKGGLKAVEKLAGVQRSADIGQLDGFQAVNLWYSWERYGNRAALDRLLKYNEADVRSLPELWKACCIYLNPDNS